MLFQGNWAKSEVRLARDGKGYTLLEFEAHYGENYEWHWNLAERCSGARHRWPRNKALLRLLKEHNNYIIGWKILTQPSSAEIIPLPVRQRILRFLLPTNLCSVLSQRLESALERTSKILKPNKICEMPAWVCG
jgi:hypothetical protein